MIAKPTATGSENLPIDVGSIGRPILTKFNLLLDYHHLHIIATNDLKKMENLGCVLHEMQKIPFQMGLLGITFKMHTKLGIKSFCIDTGASSNIIRSSLVNVQNCKIGNHNIPLFTSNCMIQDLDLGDLTFHTFDLADQLTDIDGILGTPFLDLHMLYIDFKNRVLYIKKS